jgi:predicted GNAT family acetyltransferase
MEFSNFDIRGKGLADKLCDAAYSYAAANKFTVIPSCTYISGKYLKKREAAAAAAASGVSP